MSVSRLTAMMIETNEVKFLDTAERSECWIVKNGELHALLLSCPFVDRPKMEQFVREIQSQELP